MIPQTIDNYRLTSMEEPSDEVLAQLMREAAEEASRTNRGNQTGGCRILI